MLQLQKNIKENHSLKNVYLGYNLLKKNTLVQDRYAFGRVGNTACNGFEKETLENLIDQDSKLFLCFVALPMDRQDYLIENNMLDWDFEGYLRNLLNTTVISIGALRKNEYRCRTFKFLYQK